MAGPGPAEAYAAKLTTAAKAVSAIADGETVSVGMAIGQPPALLAALADWLRANDLKRIRLCTARCRAAPAISSWPATWSMATRPVPSRSPRPSSACPTTSPGC